jgi:glycosyltransferase involved in cell wall biosynthesis
MSNILNILNAFNNQPEPEKQSVEIKQIISTEEPEIVKPVQSISDSHKNIIAELKKPKISIIMQSYLGDYNGSRTNAIDKFIRAVDSFNQQLYKNCELIIVADGCVNTFNTYMAKYQLHPNIKIAFVDKKGTPRMYDTVEVTDKPERYYRGIPRQIGLEMATGEIVTYMDSDDYLMPKFTLNIVSAYNVNPDADWFINRSWYDNIEADWEKETVFASYNRNDAIRIDGLPSKWVPTKLKEKMIILSPWLLTHKRSCKTKWADSIGVSEDVSFNQRLRKEYPNGIAYESAMYVRCHYSEQWDY